MISQTEIDELKEKSRAAGYMELLPTSQSEDANRVRVMLSDAARRHKFGDVVGSCLHALMAWCIGRTCDLSLRWMSDMFFRSYSELVNEVFTDSTVDTLDRSVKLVLDSVSNMRDGTSFAELMCVIRAMILSQTLSYFMDMFDPIMHNKIMAIEIGSVSIDQANAAIGSMIDVRRYALENIIEDETAMGYHGKANDIVDGLMDECHTDDDIETIAFKVAMLWIDCIVNVNSGTFPLDTINKMRAAATGFGVSDDIDIDFDVSDIAPNMNN